jgi:hypothetical protein
MLSKTWRTQIWQSLKIHSTIIIISSSVKGLPKSIGKMPTSCADLKQIGYLKSGAYSVMGGKNVLNVYCDFTVDDKSENPPHLKVNCRLRNDKTCLI